MKWGESLSARYLILEDGSVFSGEGFGSPAVTFGEVVFNTSMAGYQELITNPVYFNQIVVFTQPTWPFNGTFTKQLIHQSRG